VDKMLGMCGQNVHKYLQKNVVAQPMSSLKFSHVNINVNG